MPITSHKIPSSDEKTVSVGVDKYSGTLSYDAVQPYLEYIECKIVQYLGSYARTFDHVLKRGLSREFHAWKHTDTTNVQLAVATILNYYRQVMSQYFWYCNIAQDRYQHDVDNGGHIEIYALINNFETAMWENQLEPLLGRQQHGNVTFQCNVNTVQDNDCIDGGGEKCTKQETILNDSRPLLCVSPCDVDCCNDMNKDFQDLMQQSIDDESEKKFLQYMNSHGNKIVKGEQNDEDTEHHLSELFGEDYTTSSLSSSDENTSHESSKDHVTSRHPMSPQDGPASKRRKRNTPPKSVSFQQTAATRFLSIPTTFSVEQTKNVAKCISANTALVERGKLSTDDAMGNVETILQHLLMQKLNGLPSKQDEVLNIGS